MSAVCLSKSGGVMPKRTAELLISSLRPTEVYMGIIYCCCRLASLKMYESPGSLQDACLDYICENISEICEAQPSSDEDGQSSLVFSAEEVFLPSYFSDQILACLCEKHKLTDQTMTLFDAKCTSLKRAKIKDAPLTLRGLRMLKSHKLIELEATGLKNITVNDLVGCLGEWSLANLRHLNVANSTFLSNAKFHVVVSLSKLRKLQTLNVSYTEFNERGLEIIAEDLPCLESLDISNTPVNDLSPLRKCKHSLRSLSMYNLRASHSEDIVPVLAELTNLHHLDVSDDFSVQPFMNLQPQKFKIQDLLQRTKCFPHLVSLDISGKEGIPEELLRWEYQAVHVAMLFCLWRHHATKRLSLLILCLLYSQRVSRHTPTHAVPGLGTHWCLRV